MVVETFPVGPLACNCSIVIDPRSQSCVVIDPGGDFDDIRSRLERARAKPFAIVHTHAHIDHVGATACLQRWSGATARIHEADRFLYRMLPVQAALLGMQIPGPCEMAGDLEDNAVVGIGDLGLAVLHTPGHSPGSVSFVLAFEGRTIVFAGDTLFCRGIGRTDLWGGDAAQMVRSLRTKLFTLDENTTVVPGHGPTTTIGQERRHNPFVRL